tara:strand:- start:485 stop:862 length:378 start_codon:yes stop_codon:yes gene_type:complete
MKREDIERKEFERKVNMQYEDMFEFKIFKNPRLEESFKPKREYEHIYKQEMMDRIQMKHEKALHLGHTTITNYLDWLTCQYILSAGSLRIKTEELEAANEAFEEIMSTLQSKLTIEEIEEAEKGE